MTDTERAALIEKAARAVWHSVGGAEDWETLDEDDDLREVCLIEAKAALDAVGFFSLLSAAQRVDACEDPEASETIEAFQALRNAIRAAFVAETQGK